MFNVHVFQTKGCIWQMVYQCVPMDSKKDCSGKLEMRLLGDSDRQRNGKQYPCQVIIVDNETLYEIIFFGFKGEHQLLPQSQHHKQHRLQHGVLQISRYSQVTVKFRFVSFLSKL